MDTRQIDIRKLTLKRGACYGPCPVYEITLLADGTVTWVGEIFVDSVGPASWTIPIKRVFQIQGALRRAGFHLLADSYTRYDMTDASSCDIIVEFADGTSKAVEHYHGDLSAPQELSALENRLDRLLGTAPYIGKGRGYAPQRDMGAKSDSPDKESSDS